MADGRPHADRGMTPVVGIALLVAITLLLAATVAAFALGIEDDQRSDRVPTVAVGFEFDSNAGADDRLTIVHKSGQAVDASRLDVVVSGAECVVGGTDPDGRYNVADDFGLADTLTAGETVRIDGATVACPSGDLDLRGASVRVVWNPAGRTSTLLRTWHGPA
jgi:flagellin-like protein